ncbi:MAG TPA: EI24 domain-containing protein [Myxococcota bacterium]|jgi:uncharacterized protein involved in cysteine biosynthesis|nr:EI24 domain-containing protein [Myxococcota bacterium]
MSAVEVLDGARLHLAGLRLLWRERRLWPLAAVPFLLSAFAFGATAALLFLRRTDLHRFVTGWLPDPRAHAWWEWIWVGPAVALLGALGWLLFAALSLALVVAAFLLVSVVASPFLDALSRRVEQIASGRERETHGESLATRAREGARAVGAEIQRTLLFLTLQAVVFVGGIVLPGGQAVAPLALALLTMLFLPLDHASFALDRWGVPFRARRRWLVERAPLLLGFGATAFAVCAVPVLNFLAMPLFVTSGTLLALRHPPGGAATRARGGGAGRPTSP